MITAADVVSSDSVLAQYNTSLVLANLALAVILPQVVALITSKVAQSPLKAVLLVVVSAIGGLVTQIVTEGGDFNWRTALISFAQVFFGSVATHYGLLKPTGVTGSDGIIQTSVPSGLGSGGGIPPLSNGSPN